MDQLMINVINTLCEDVGTPRALAVKLLVGAGEWEQVLNLRVRHPSDYETAHHYWLDCSVTDLLRKCKLPSGIDTRAAAVDTFWACEIQNCRTNSRLSRFIGNQGPFEASDLRVASFITSWRKEVSRVLGMLPSALSPRFSGGATYADVGKLTTIPDKMSSTPTISDSARPVVLPFWEQTSWARTRLRDFPQQSEPRSVRGNIFFTVPKDGLKDRGCCKEPSLNISFQLDCGRIIRNRLKRIGIDLLHDQDKHRALAREYSISGLGATIDMSNASDTLCRVLPFLVLPPDWAELLDSLRSKFTRVDGRWVRLEKFSSMGNGFTFELETLIFATLARTVISEQGGDVSDVSCYGDDLIVPSQYASDIIAALRFFGFDTNKKKTFVEGPFRESCGGDFFEGEPVRAHFLKELPDEPQHWISLANGLRRMAFANTNSCPRWDIVRRAWLRALSALPSDIRRCRGPVHLGDIVIHDAPEYWNLGMPRLGDPSWEPLFVKAYTPVAEVLPWHHWKPGVQLATCTLGVPSTGVTPRGSITGHRLTWVSTLTCDWTPSSAY